MASRRSAVLGLGILLVAPGCRDGTGPEHVVPLAVGAAWVYRVTETDSTGQVLRVTGDTLTLLADTVMDGTVWYRATRTPTLWAPIGRGFIANRADGLWFVELDSDSVSLFGAAPHLYFRYPATVGDVYMPDPTVFRLPLRVMSVDEACEAPTVTLRCIRYDSGSGVSHDASYWVAPGVGLVAAEYPVFGFDVDSLGAPRWYSQRVDLVDFTQRPP